MLHLATVTEISLRRITTKMGKKPLPKLKIAVVGTSGVGKYSLSHQFANGWIAPRDSNGKLGVKINGDDLPSVTGQVKLCSAKQIAECSIAMHHVLQLGS